MLSSESKSWSCGKCNSVLKDFSFVLPSRGEQEWLCKFLDSLERTTFNKDKIEVLIAVDPGRDDVFEFIKEQKYKFKIDIFERKKTEDFTNNYYNWLANKSTGRHIWAFNDDAWFKTDAWDKKILDVVSKTGWSIYFVDVLDTARLKYNNKFPCFPLVSRKAFCLLGWVLFPPVKMYPGDKWTHEIYHHARRVIRVPNVVIEHEHTLEDTDPRKAEMMRIFRKQDFSNIDLGPSIHQLLSACSTDFNKNKTKFKRILEIIKENE